MQVRRAVLALALALTVGCSVPRHYRPAVFGTGTLAGVAAAGYADDLDRAARELSTLPFGSEVSRPETWAAHAMTTGLACGVGALLAWDKDGCVPAALASVLYYGVKESIEWGHPGFSPVDGLMDFIAPAATASVAVGVFGIPPWKRCGQR